MAVGVGVGPSSGRLPAAEQASALPDGTVQDVTDVRAQEDRIRFLAFHDPLTDLPNRMLLMERLGQLIGQTEREERSVAVIFPERTPCRVCGACTGCIMRIWILT